MGLIMEVAILDLGLKTVIYFERPWGLRYLDYNVLQQYIPHAIITAEMILLGFFSKFFLSHFLEKKMYPLIKQIIT
jgi:hypothetical protein